MARRLENYQADCNNVMHQWLTINHGIGQWPPSEMDAMSLSELDQWYEIACQVLKAKADALDAVKKK